MSPAVILTLVVAVLLGATGFAGYQYFQERALREQAIDGYNQVVKRWQDNQAALTDLNEDLALARGARADLERQVMDHDLETLSRTDSPALLAFVNGTAARLLNEFAAATGSAPARAPEPGPR